MHTELTLADIVQEHRRSRADRVAVVDGDLRRTYAELDDSTTELANALIREGVRRGDRILWIGANSHKIIELLIAASRIGAALCVANWRQSCDEFRFLIDDLKPPVVFWEPHIATASPEVLGIGTSIRWVRCGGSDDDYEPWLRYGRFDARNVPVSEHDPVLVLYTAAFDGRPNGALLSQRALIQHSLVLAAQRRVEEGFVFLDSGPMFHVGTMMFAIATLVTGGTNVILRDFDPEDACALIERERCQGAMLFPAMIERLKTANSDKQYDLSSLSFAPGDDRWNEMITIDDSPWGRSNYGYGQTEVAGMLTYHALGIGGIGTSGRPSPLVQVRVVDPDGVDVVDGEVGEIVARGAHLFSGYWNRPELNAEKFRDGWYHTGDLGRRERDGTISFVGPKLRMIKSGGENVYPAEVERALLAHKDVNAAAVIGCPDDDWGQSVVAVVVRNESSDVSESDLIGHVRRTVASYKKPRAVVFVDSIPMRGMVPDYDLLDKNHGGGGYPGQ
ncbi:AMP-binding protein [Rhodococcus sp. C26F]